MREIKFRAWNGEHEEMNYGLDFGQFWRNGWNCALSTALPIPSVLDEEKSDEVATWMENSIFMQYTGLKDKNGVEVYEGDIVRRIEYLDDTYKTEVVEWDRSFDGDGYLCTGFLIEVFDKNDMEVIGNKFQNPELLKNE